jgi:hypothetical protein
MELGDGGRRQAIEDLSVIRQTMDRVRGSTYFADYIHNAGILFVLFGVLAMAAGALTHLILNGMLVLSRPRTVIAAAWAAVGVVVSIAKTVIVARRGRAAGMSVWGYGLSMLSPSFLHTVLPIAFGAVVLLVHFWRAGEFSCLPAVFTLYVGAVYAALSGVYLLWTMTAAAYEMAALGAVGLLFMSGCVGAYLALVGAAFMVNGIVLMAIMRRRTGSAATEGQADG